MDTKIYSIFPACGKTWLYEHQEDYNIKILDSDSSQFSWLEYPLIHKDYNNKPDKAQSVKVRNPDFPNNYIKHIKENIGKYDCIFVSSHASVREALDAEGIDFTIVYPEQSRKAEWVGRCFIREQNGESGCGTKVMYDNFDKWVGECFETGINHNEVVLGAGEYLTDYFRKHWRW